MTRKTTSIKIIQEGDERFMVRTFDDGTIIREPILKLKRRKRYPDHPYWHWDLGKSKRKDE
jgi:hypothetical protein